MLFAIVKNNAIVQTIKVGKPFEFDGKTYSHKWSVQLTDAEKTDLGITEVVYGSRADERFYWVTEAGVSIVNNVPTMEYTAIAKDIDQLKTQWIAQVKSFANSQLAQTDWVVIRKAERNVEIPADIAEQRAQILTDCQTKETAINAATTVEELITAIA